MNILLDTHIFLWFISRDTRLSDELIALIRNSENQVHLSVVSLWESLIKFRLGKLPIPQRPEIYLPEQRERHCIMSLDVDEQSVKLLATLPELHRDPFDRMLICQALAHDMALMTVDSIIQAYPIRTL
jgi:PIN domain nuclease of toxin-antitoxin system